MKYQVHVLSYDDVSAMKNASYYGISHVIDVRVRFFPISYHVHDNNFRPF